MVDEEGGVERHGVDLEGAGSGCEREKGDREGDAQEEKVVEEVPVGTCGGYTYI